MILYFFPLITAFLWAAINHFDKYLLEKYLKGADVGSLVIFSSLIGLPSAILVFLFKGVALVPNWMTAVYLIVNGIFFVFSIIPYFYALSKDEASIVAPLSQFAPMFSFIMGYLFLDELLTVKQLLSFLIIIFGSVLLVFERDVKNKKIKFKFNVLILMLIYTFFQALNGLVFKVLLKANDLDFWTVSFWQFIGFFLASILLFTFIKNYRKEFLKVLKVNKGSILFLNFINEAMATVAGLLLQYASIYLPLAVVSVIADGTQPFFVLVIGIILTVFFPKISKEDISFKKLAHKIVSISLIVGGTFLLIR